MAAVERNRVHAGKFQIRGTGKFPPCPWGHCRDDTRPGRPANLPEGNAGMNADGMVILTSYRLDAVGTMLELTSGGTSVARKGGPSKRNAKEDRSRPLAKRKNRDQPVLAGVRIKAQDIS